jgi:hypothetical protein
VPPDQAPAAVEQEGRHLRASGLGMVHAAVGGRAVADFCVLAPCPADSTESDEHPGSRRHGAAGAHRVVKHN